MKFLEISSNKNDQYKELLKLKQKKYRYRSECFLIEGIKLIRHAIDKGEAVSIFMYSAAYLTPELIENFKAMLPDTTLCLSLSKELFDDLSDTVNSQGVMAVVKFPKPLIDISADGLYLALDHVQDPGNLGTMIRTADAAGFSGLIYSKGTVDPFSEKVLRSTMGSVFSLPLMACEDLPAFLKIAATNKQMQVLCTSLADSYDYAEADYSKGSIIVIGNESQGVSQEVFDTATTRIKIPIYGEAESLNAAVAAAIIMYEAVKQRR